MKHPPIFVIGTGRCGSTILFEGLIRHRDLAWMTNYDHKFPKSNLAALHHFLRRLPFFDELALVDKIQNQKVPLINFQRILIQAAEAYPKWNLICGDNFGKDFLLGKEATEDAKKRIQNFFELVVRRQGKQRFIAKITGPPRISYLHSVFPDASFLHVVRQPCAVVASLLKRAKHWKRSVNEPWWTNGLPSDWEQTWKEHGQTPAALGAIQYKAIMDACTQEKAVLSNDQYFEVTYQEFIEETEKVVKTIFEFLALNPSLEVEKEMFVPGKYKNMNFKYSESLHAKDIEAICQITGWSEPEALRVNRNIY